MDHAGLWQAAKILLSPYGLFLSYARLEEFGEERNHQLVRKL